MILGKCKEELVDVEVWRRAMRDKAFLLSSLAIGSKLKVLFGLNRSSKIFTFTTRTRCMTESHAIGLK